MGSHTPGCCTSSTDLGKGPEAFHCPVGSPRDELLGYSTCTVHLSAACVSGLGWRGRENCIALHPVPIVTRRTAKTIPRASQGAVQPPSRRATHRARAGQNLRERCAQLDRGAAHALCARVTLGPFTIVPFDSPSKLFTSLYRPWAKLVLSECPECRCPPPKRHGNHEDAFAKEAGRQVGRRACRDDAPRMMQLWLVLQRGYVRDIQAEIWARLFPGRFVGEHRVSADDIIRKTLRLGLG
ncbi:unnamed protein product [Diplocarpon coronariae]